MPALIFDCDGVLADTEADGHLPAFNATFAEFGLPIVWSTDDYAKLLQIGGGKERIASVLDDDFLTSHGMATDPEGRAELLRRLHLRKTELFKARVEQGLLPGRPGIARLIAEALGSGWTVAVASTSAPASVKAVLSHAVGPELAGRVHVFAGDIVPAKKPAPDIYLKVLADLALDPSQCVVIEDSAIGLRAASAAGLPTVVTKSAFTGGEDFDEAALVLAHLGDPDNPVEHPWLPTPMVRLADLDTLIHNT